MAWPDAVFRVQADDARQLARWSPRGLQYPRFLIAADVSRDGTALHPVGKANSRSSANAKSPKSAPRVRQLRPANSAAHPDSAMQMVRRQIDATRYKGAELWLSEWSSDSPAFRLRAERR